MYTYRYDERCTPSFNRIVIYILSYDLNVVTFIRSRTQKHTRYHQARALPMADEHMCSRVELEMKPVQVSREPCHPGAELKNLTSENPIQ